MARKQRGKGTGTLYKRSDRGPWIASWYTHEGNRRERSTRTTDKATAERILRQFTDRAAQERAGLVDARLEAIAAHEARGVGEHLGEWKAALIAKGVSPKQVHMATQRARAIVEAVKAGRPADLTVSGVQTALAELHKAGKSLQSCHHYARAVKQFSRWMHRDGRTRLDPLVSVAGFNAATDRRHVRRALDGSEIRALIETTAAAGPWRGMTGPDRAMLYRLAAGSGFRRNELASLTPASFNLVADPPTITLKAAHSKHRTEDIQPIRADLAATLRPWLVKRPADAPIFPTLPDRTADMLKADLRLARARWITATPIRAERRKRREAAFLRVSDAQGRVADFHALRVSYITALVKGGASVKVAQQLARHSDPKLTMNTYTRLGVTDTAAALDALPQLGPEEPQRERMRATGTYGDAEHHQLFPQQLGCDSQRNGARGSERNRPQAVKISRDSGFEPETFGSVDRCSVQLS